jgi:hypothetical protein
MTTVKLQAQIDDLKAKIVLRIDSNLTTRFSSTKCDFVAFELLNRKPLLLLLVIVIY